MRFESLTHIGATELCKIIKAYWDKRGYQVNPTVECAKGEVHRGLFHIVVSDMKNGLPVGPRRS